MKTNLYLLSLCVLTVTACSKKDKPNPTPPPPSGSTISAAISKQLSATDTLSDFSAAYKTTTLSDADVSTGVTIFAPSNNAFGAGATSPTSELLQDSSNLKDYIVKGSLKASDLTNSKTLTTLSGKTLTVTVSGSIVTVNDMVVNASAPYTGDGFIIYSTSKLLNAAAPLTFTIYDATQWSSSQPKGGLASGATVSLYVTREDYASNSKPVASLQTGSNGAVTFNGIKPGAYYVVAAKGAISNVFNLYTQPFEGTYTGYYADSSIDAQGNIIFKDLNMDLVVNSNDVGYVPSLQTQASKTASVNISIVMGYAIKPLQTQNDAQIILNATYSNLLAAYNGMVVLDGVLSDDANCAGQPNYCTYDNFTFTAADGTISLLWSGTYNLIGNLNRIVKDVPNMNIAADQKADLIAQAKGLRAYIYLSMTQYFGDIPIHKEYTSSFFPGIARSSTTDVYNYIVSDLTAAAADLPATRASGKLQLTKYAAYALLAKAALWKKDYTNLASYTAQVMNSAAYTLTTTNTWLTSGNNVENIWTPTFATINPLLAWYFTGQFGATTATTVPVIRYGEILLMDAEAQIMLGNFGNAQTDINAVLNRRSLGPVTITGPSDGMPALQSAWQTETYRQGDRFLNLLRWGLAANVLTPNGFMNGKSNLLPIPRDLQQSYPNMVQNPGY